jgi:hypothetical protein
MSNKISDVNTINLAGNKINIDNLLKGQEPSNNTEAEPTEEELLLSSADDIAEELYASPSEMWRQECDLYGLSMEEAAKILDAVMSRGFYEESYRVAGKVFKLRTRTTVDGDRLIEMLRELRPDNNAVLTHLVARINLASSLSSFANEVFSHTYPSDDNRHVLDAEWKSRWSYTSSLPQPIFLAVTQTLQNFDEKVALACDARALENF